MALLTAAVTFLTLAGTPGQPPGPFTRSPSGAPRSYQQFTAHGPAGVAARLYGSFAGKAASTTDARFPTDTYRLVLTMGDVSEVAPQLVDRYVPTLAMSGVGGLARFGSDTYLPVVTLTVAALQKAGGPSLVVTDSLVPVLTMAAAQSFANSVADSLVPVLTMTCTAASAPEVTPSDTYVPVLGMTYLLDQTIGTVAVALTDTYVPTLSLSSGLRVAGEVDRIWITSRPCGRIRIREV